MFKSGYSRRCYFPKRTSPQRFDELPDLDHFICPAAVPVIAIPLAFARRRERRGSDKRSSRSKPDMGTPSPPLDFLILKNRKPIHHQILKFSETETRVSID